MPLQDMPQTFSCMQDWHISKPHLHRQQNEYEFVQQWHFCSALRRHRLFLVWVRLVGMLPFLSFFLIRDRSVFFLVTGAS